LPLADDVLRLGSFSYMEFAAQGSNSRRHWFTLDARPRNISLTEAPKIILLPPNFPYRFKSPGPRKLEYRRCPSGVHLLKSIRNAITGSSDRHSVISGAASTQCARRFVGRFVNGQATSGQLLMAAMSSRRTLWQSVWTSMSRSGESMWTNGREDVSRSEAKSVFRARVGRRSTNSRGPAVE